MVGWIALALDAPRRNPYNRRNSPGYRCKGSLVTPLPTETTHNNTNRILLGLIVVLLIAITGVILFILFRAIQVPPTAEYDGSTPLRPPMAVPDWSLTDQYGNAVQLSELRGKPVLFSFGYTHCPDVCPLTLNEFKRIYEGLGERGDDVAFMFISVDGERDTPEALRRYFDARGISQFIGLTGTEDEMRAVGEAYGLYFAFTPNPVRPDDYLVDHTAGSFLLDGEGRWIYRYAFQTEPDVILEDIQALLG
jgi:protein SCO1